MRVQRKCTNCGSWNEGQNDHCQECGQLLSPEKIFEKESAERAELLKERRSGRLEHFFDRFKNTRNPLLKALYHILRTGWLVYMAILSFFLWLIALTPG